MDTISSITGGNGRGNDKTAHFLALVKVPVRVGRAKKQGSQTSITFYEGSDAHLPLWGGNPSILLTNCDRMDGISGLGFADWQVMPPNLAITRHQTERQAEQASGNANGSGTKENSGTATPVAKITGPIMQVNHAERDRGHR